MPKKGQKASVTFRVTLSLAALQRRASLQRSPVVGVPYLLALSKFSLNRVLGVECSNHYFPNRQVAWVSGAKVFLLPELRRFHSLLLPGCIIHPMHGGTVARKPPFLANTALLSTIDLATLLSTTTRSSPLSPNPIWHQLKQVHSVECVRLFDKSWRSFAGRGGCRLWPCRLSIFLRGTCTQCCCGSPKHTLQMGLY